MCMVAREKERLDVGTMYVHIYSYIYMMMTFAYMYIYTIYSKGIYNNVLLVHGQYTCLYIMYIDIYIFSLLYLQT